MSDDQCDRSGDPGVCQSTGYCSFPDDSCDSDQRYGELAPTDLAGTCVPGPGSGSSETGTPSAATSIDMPTSGTSTLPDDSTTSTDGGMSSSSSDDTGTDDSSSGGIPMCCQAGCDGACDERPCPAQQLGEPSMEGAEALGVAVIGDWVVWSTGWAGVLEVTDPATGVHQLGIGIPNNQYATHIDADDDHVYVLDWGGGSVKRTTVPEGVVETVTEVEGGQAGFGSIIVGSEYVYFTMRTSGGVWRAAKDLSMPEAELVAMTPGNPFDVDIDSTHVYWVETDPSAIFRMAFDDIGSTTSGDLVANGDYMTELYVDEDWLYFADGGSLFRSSKSGDAVTTLANDSGSPWSLEGDDEHLYWTAVEDIVIRRVSKNGGPMEDLTEPGDNITGLDLGCTDVYWTQTTTNTLHTRPK
ncbi:MAG: hypothetical protein AAF799_16190 [Myxococcota bacterium]